MKNYQKLLFHVKLLLPKHLRKRPIVEYMGVRFKYTNNNA
jgi:hypothetical protein